MSLFVNKGLINKNVKNVKVCVGLVQLIQTVKVVYKMLSCKEINAYAKKSIQ